MHRKKRGNEICFVNKTLQNRARKKHAGLFATGTKKYFQYVIPKIDKFDCSLIVYKYEIFPHIPNNAMLPIQLLMMWKAF